MFFICSVVDGGQDSNLIGLEGKEILIPCGTGGEKVSCRWSPPYNGLYDLQPNDYAERGRLQADTSCHLRVSSLQVFCTIALSSFIGFLINHLSMDIQKGLIMNHLFGCKSG